MSSSHIAENIERILNSIGPEVSLVAVSKTKPVDMIREAYAAGQRDFGENYVQELVDKQPQLPADIRWHFIGHLQSNKVKYIAPFVHLVHGVDSFKLLQEINKQAEKNQRVINCLLQVYIAREVSKFGLDFDECEAILQDQAKDLHHVKILGLMGMASNTADAEQVRHEYHTLHEFYVRMRDNVQDMSVLSAGMSGDYQVALEEGANMIRIGSTIFGSRQYT